MSILTAPHTHRVPRRVAAVAVTCLAGLAGGPLAWADPGPAHGWWWVVEQGSVAVPPPTTVPPGGLYISATPTGAAAVSALRTDVPPGATAGVLALKVSSTSGTPLVVACPTTGSWQVNGGAGAWSSRPAADCRHGVPATVDTATGIVRVDLPAGWLRGGAVDLVLEPGTDPATGQSGAFDLSTAAVGPTAFTFTGGAGPSPATPTTAASPPAPSPAAAPGPPAPAVQPAAGAVPGPPFGPVPPATGGPPPAVAPSGPPAPSGSPAAVTAVTPTARSGRGIDRGATRPAALVVLGLLVAVAAVLSPVGAGVRARRLPWAPAAAAVATPVGPVRPVATVPGLHGVGRFRSVRTGPPPGL